MFDESAVLRGLIAMVLSNVVATVAAMSLRPDQFIIELLAGGRILMTLRDYRAMWRREAQRLK